MAWSLTAPTLPSNSSWSQAGTTTWESNNLKITSVVSVARLSGTGFALKVVETRTWYKNDVKASYLRCDVAGSNAGANTTLTWSTTSGTRTAYFTGTAAAGTSLKVYVGQDNDGTNYGTATFTAPALLDSGSSGGSTGGETGGGSSGDDSGTTGNWTTTAPSLPNGSSWVQKGTTSLDQNNLTLTTIVSCARLTGNGFAIRVAETRNVHTTDLTDFFKYYHRCDVGSTTGTASTGNWLNVGNNNTTQYFYCTGTAAPGTKITITIGVTSDRSDLMKTVTFTAPDLLGAQVWVNVSGTWKKATAVYTNVNGSWKTGPVKVNVGGTWK